MTNNKMQWAIIAVVSILGILSVILPFITYWLTHNWITLASSSVAALPMGFVWNWITKRVFPLNQQDHERELIRIIHRRDILTKSINFDTQQEKA
jgi:hypothetical protein